MQDNEEIKLDPIEQELYDYYKLLDAFCSNTYYFKNIEKKRTNNITSVIDAKYLAITGIKKQLELLNKIAPMIDVKKHVEFAKEEKRLEQLMNDIQDYAPWRAEE